MELRCQLLPALTRDPDHSSVDAITRLARITDALRFNPGIVARQCGASICMSGLGWHAPLVGAFMRYVFVFVHHHYVCNKADKYFKMLEIITP